MLQDGLYSGSLDGMTLAGDLIVEIKVPYKGQGSTLRRSVEGGDVPAHYVAQVQYQLMVSGATLAHLWVYDGRHGLLHEIKPDLVEFERIRRAWEAFAVFLDTDTPPPLTEADSRRQDDPDWESAASTTRRWSS